jgi:hypothetical protein
VTPDAFHKQVGMDDDEELLVAAARVRQELQPGRSLNRTIGELIAQAIEH